MKKFNLKKRLFFIILAIIITGVFSWFTWRHAYNLESQVIDYYDYKNDAMVAVQANRFYDKAFKEIIIFDGFVFISTFLLLYSWKKEEKGKE